MPPRFSFSAALLLLFGLMLLRPAPSAAQQAGGPVVDGIAAVVGDEVILRSEVDVLVSSLIQRGLAQEYSDALWTTALNELVNQKVLSEQAERDTTITVSDAQVSQALDRRVEQLAAQAGGEEALEELYGTSILELKEDFREDFREQLLAQQLRATKAQEIDITPSEVRAWFEEIPEDSLPALPTTVRLGHVVRYPAPSEEAEQRALELAQAIRDSIVYGGAAIEEMARRFSDDPGSAATGGRIQGVRIQDLYPEFAAVASRLPADSLSQPVRTPIGYHLIRVNERAGNLIDFNHVLIRVDERQGLPTETIEYLEMVRDSIVQYGAPLELMASRHSEEAVSARSGGRVIAPRVGTRDLVLERLGPSWQQTIDTLEVGEVSRPAQVELLNGRQAYHIVLLQDLTPAHEVNFQTDYVRIRQYALQEKRARMLQEWIDALREQIYVDIRMQPEDLTATRR